jgi:ferredoxin
MIDAREVALSTLDSVKTTPTSLINFQSNGRVIVFGDESALSLCQDFSDPLIVTRISMNGSSQADASSDAIALNEREIDIQGHLGKFTVRLVDAHDMVETLQADIILDLNSQPLISLEIPPPGYLHDSATDADSKSLEDQLLEMTGEFEKPKYFKYNASICAHGVNGKTVCTHCIDACPAGAISSLIETIEVDPYLCQGGGACAASCPSGAIQYVYPRLTDSGNRVRTMLQAFRQEGGKQAIIMFHAETEFPQLLLQQQASILPVRVEELASVGVDLCLSALVYGASQVVLLCNDEIPKLSRAELEWQLEWLQAVLGGLGLDPGQISLQALSAEFVPMQSDTLVEPAIYTMPDNKRHAILQAVDHLYQQMDQQQELVDLPQGAPFGTVTINETTCTLCMACVGACPGKALQDGSNREVPEIFFIESNCIQCGACTQTCPESAITISPRMIFDRERRNHSRPLNQDIPFACISCGKPFAPKSVIDKMTDQLKDHYMFNSPRALDRLKMCEDCRVVDIVQDPEAMKGNFDPLN